MEHAVPDAPEKRPSVQEQSDVEFRCHDGHSWDETGESGALVIGQTCGGGGVVEMAGNDVWLLQYIKTIIRILNRGLYEK